MPTIRTVCAHDCPDMCSLLVTVEEGRIRRIAGDPDQPFARRPYQDPTPPYSVHLARGMNPGTPLSTTGLNRTLVVTLFRISCMASSGRTDMSKFS